MIATRSRIFTPTAAAWFVTLTFILIGGFDVAMGAYLLLSSTPWLAHGPGTVWSTGGDLGAAGESLYQRIGVFSFHVGVVTMVLGWYGRRFPFLRTILVAIYLLTGIAFAVYDNHWFTGTTYWWAKMLLGVLFAAAAVIQFLGTYKRWWETAS